MRDAILCHIAYTSRGRSQNTLICCTHTHTHTLTGVAAVDIFKPLQNFRTVAFGGVADFRSSGIFCVGNIHKTRTMCEAALGGLRLRVCVCVCKWLCVA